MIDVKTPDRFLTFAEAAEMLGLSEEALRNGECGTNELLKIELGKQERTTRFSFNDVQSWMMALARKALEDRQWQEGAIREYLVKIGKAYRKQFVKDTITTIVNGEKYER